MEDVVTGTTNAGEGENGAEQTVAPPEQTQKPGSNAGSESQGGGGSDIPDALAREYSRIDADDNVFEHQKEALKAKAKEEYLSREKRRKEREAELAAEKAEQEAEEAALLGKEGGEAAKKADKPAEEQTPAAKENASEIKDDTKIKFKSNGEEVEVPVSELKKSYGLAAKAQGVLKDYAEQTKTLGNIFGAINAGADGVEHLLNAVLKDQTGDKAFEIAQNIVKKRLKIITMTDEERKIYDQEMELARYKNLDEQRKNQQLQAEEEQNHQALKQHFGKIIVNVTKESGLPNTAFVRSLINQGLMLLTQKGHSAQQIGDGKALIPWVKKQWEAHQKELYSETFSNPESMATPEMEEKWRKYLNAKYEAGKKPSTPPPSVTSGVDKAGKPSKTSKSKKTIADFGGDREAFLAYLHSKKED